MADVEMGEVCVVLPSLLGVVDKGGLDDFTVVVESAAAHRRMPVCVIIAD